MKKLTAIVLSLIMIVCACVPVFADANTDKAKVESYVLSFVSTGSGSPLLKEHSADNLKVVAYQFYEDDTDWYAIVYDGDEFVCDFFAELDTGIPHVSFSAGLLSMDEGLRELKENTGASDKDIKLAFTPEGAYASAFDNKEELRRVGYRPRYGNVMQFSLDNTYTLDEIIEAREEMFDYIDEETDYGNLMGGVFNLSIDDFLKPAFPVWGYFAIGGGVVIIAAVLFLALKKKQKSE